MLEVREEDIDKVTALFHRVLKGEVPRPLDLPKDYPENEVKQVVEYANRFVAEYQALGAAMSALSRGDLDLDVPAGKMHVLQSFKNLHANLRHLTWKTQQIAAGDLSQHVDFMGDFSKAFNSMTGQLREAFAKIERQNQELSQANQRMKRDLDAAARVQQTLLPESFPEIQGLNFAWTYKPCDELAGDALNIVRINEDLTALYLLDVSGHGVPAALLSVTVTRSLHPHAGGAPSLVAGPGANPDAVDPAQVASRLNALYPMASNGDHYFTMIYGVYDKPKRMLACCNAGHPAALLFTGPSQKDATLRQIESTDPMVGICYVVSWWIEGAWLRRYIKRDVPELADRCMSVARNANVLSYVFLLAVAGYLLSFSGLPISDDEELYASAARNLAVTGRLSAEQLYGNARLAGSYHGVEPAFPAVASLWYRLFLHSGLGHLQTMYLLPILCTALSAALIIIIAGQLGFSATLGTLAGLCYGFSSMAWPYAKTLFREPLIALLLLCCLSVFLWIVREKRQRWPTVIMVMLLITLLAALTLARVVLAVTAVVLLFAALGHPAIRRDRKVLALVGAGGLILILALGAGLGALHATDADVFYRFTGGFAQDAIARLKTIGHSHLIEALTAPLVSPWKGLLFYSPICLTGLLSLILYGRRQPIVSLLTIVVLSALLVMQALAYDAEWWTPTWGSRFLVPVIPLLTIASLPLLERLAQRGRGGWLAITVTFAAGFAFQLPAVLFNSAEFTAATYQQVSGRFPQALIWNAAKTPIITQWHAMASQTPDLLLWRTAGAQPALVFLTSALAAAAILTALCFMPRLLTGSRHRVVVSLAPVVVLTAFASLALLSVSADDPAYEPAALEPMCRYISNHVQAADVLIVQPYPGPAWQYLMNRECGQRTWYSLPYEDVADSSAVKLIAEKIPEGARYWIIQQFWSETFAPEQSILATGGDRLLQAEFITSPYHLFIASYKRGQR